MRNAFRRDRAPSDEPTPQVTHQSHRDGSRTITVLPAGFDPRTGAERERDAERRGR